MSRNQAGPAATPPDAALPPGVTMSEAELQQRLNNTHWAGRAGALEDAAQAAAAKAGELFAGRKDGAANAWREFADWLAERGRAARAEQAQVKAGQL